MLCKCDYLYIGAVLKYPGNLGAYLQFKTWSLKSEKYGFSLAADHGFDSRS